LYVGRFSEDKGLESLFEGFKKAIEIVPNICLKTVGPLTEEGGSNVIYLNKLSDFIVKNNLSDSIKISGPIYEREALDQEIAKNDVIVLPSIYGETLNMVVLECMRIGRAQLISDLPANLPLNQEGITGYFCQAGDAVSWSESIVKMANDINNREDYGSNTFNYGKNKFSSKIISKVYISDFNSLLNI